MSQVQNIRVHKIEGINNSSKFLENFVTALKYSYVLEDKELTHPSQIFITRFYLVTAPIRKVSLQIFNNGTLLIQGSPRIPKKNFDLEINQIIRLANNLIENKLFDMS